MSHEDRITNQETDNVGEKEALNEDIEKERDTEKTESDGSKKIRKAANEIRGDNEFPVNKIDTLKNWWERAFRNKLAGFLFGRYNLEEVAKRYLTEKEEFIKGIEIIFWGEEIYFVMLLILLANLLLGVILSPFLLLLPVIYVPILMYFATEIEIVIVTNERVLIEKRSFIEKLTQTQQFQSINLDQIAMLTYSRAPPNIPLLIVSFLGLIGNIAVISYETLDFRLFNSFLDMFIFISFILGFFAVIYLLWFSLRLTKRSIEIFVIGIIKPIGIGRVKGAPVWFLTELQKTVTERIHHTFHTKKSDENDTFELTVKEYPLQYSSLVKDIIKETGASLAKALILQIDKEYINVDEIYTALPHYTTSHIDNELSHLKNKTILIYNPGKDRWEINRKYKRKFLHEDSQKKL